MEQPAFADLEYRGKRRRTRRVDRSWKGKDLCNRVERVLSYRCAGASYRNRAIQPVAGEFAGFRRWFDKKAFPAPMPQVPCKELIPFTDGPEHIIIRA